MHHENEERLGELSQELSNDIIEPVPKKRLTSQQINRLAMRNGIPTPEEKERRRLEVREFLLKNPQSKTKDLKRVGLYNYAISSYGSLGKARQDAGIGEVLLKRRYSFNERQAMIRQIEAFAETALYGGEKLTRKYLSGQGYGEHLSVYPGGANALVRNLKARRNCGYS